jgi:DNA-binding transcriptional regulator YhcF (GntR family)
VQRDAERPRTGRPQRRPSSWTEVEKAILLRIVSGVYEPGQQLPSSEQPATELGANKNTVSKANRSLAERGYLRTRAGRLVILRTASAGENSPTSRP